MNTDQAYELLIDAGIQEEIGIQTVRRWLREKKISYEGIGRRGTRYIFEDTNKALMMLRDTGLDEDRIIKILERWVREGKIQNMGIERRKINNVPKEIIMESIDPSKDSNKTIRQLRLKIKAQNEQIEGFEQIHETSVNTLILQRDNLKKEIAKHEKEKNELQQETKRLLKENMELHTEIFKLKDELAKGTKRESHQRERTPTPLKMNDYYQKLGLPKNAGQKEVLAKYKKLLKLTHPDHGGNQAAFHYIKSEYDFFRKSIIKEQ